MGSAFSVGGPLSVAQHRGVTGQDEQTGFRFLYMGTAAALRNPRAHEFVDDDPITTLEHLAMISMLMRRLDASRRRRKTRRPNAEHLPDRGMPAVREKQTG